MHLVIAVLTLAITHHGLGWLLFSLGLGVLGTFTALTPVQLKLNNYAVVAGDLTVAFTAMDATNGNSYPATGTEILVFNNTDSSAHTVTINSVGDAIGRSDTSLTTYSIAANSFAMIEMKQLQGWISGGVISMTTTSALVKVAVIRWQ